MDPKPRWLTCTPSNAAVSSSSPVSSSSSSNQLFYRERLPGFDRHTRGPPLKLDSDSQSPRFHDPPKNYSTPEGCHSGWKLSPASASRDSAWADSSGGGRSKQFYHQRSSEIQLGAYPGLLGSEQDVDSRRSLMASTSRSLCSGSLHSFPEGSRHSSAGSISDSPWQVRSSPSRASVTSSSSEGLWSRREPSGSGVHSAGILGSRTTDQDNVTSCYAQGARPKEGVSTNRGSDSYLHRLPSEYQPSWLSGDSRGDASTAAGEPPVGSSDPGARRRPSWSDNWPANRPANLSERPPSSSVLCRSHGRTGDLTERHGARPLLSRLASSMSSTLFSRRSSQDPGSSGSSSSPPEAGSSLQRGGLATPDDSSSGLPFLRRRRQGSPPVPWSSSVESDLETPRASSSWLSSSFRSRCAPLFPRRRREGRDETVLAMSATAFERSRCPPVTTQGLESDATEEEEPQGAGAASHHSAHGPPQAGIDQELSGITNSLLQLAMPSTLEGTGGSTMPTVNLRAIGRTPSDEQGEENPTSSRDPERVKMIQESLLLEESDEEEGDLCRICQMGHNAPSDPLIEPCRCTGSLQYVHQECMKRWLLAKISSGNATPWLTLVLHGDLEMRLHRTSSPPKQGPAWRPSAPVSCAGRSCSSTLRTSTSMSCTGHMKGLSTSSSAAASTWWFCCTCANSASLRRWASPTTLGFSTWQGHSGSTWTTLNELIGSRRKRRHSTTDHLLMCVTPKMRKTTIETTAFGPVRICFYIKPT